MKALRRAGWSVLVAPEREYVPVKWTTKLMRAIGRAIRPRAVREFNVALRESANALAPSMLLVFKGTFLTPDTLIYLRERGVRTYCFFPDVSTRAHGPYIPRTLPVYDMVFTTKSFGPADMQLLGVSNAHVLLHAFDPDLHRPTDVAEDERSRYACDVSFIGTWSPKKEQLLAALRERAPDVHLRVWGAQWERATSAVLRSAVEGRAIEGVEYVKAIAASTINLGLLSERRTGASSGDQVTSRTFHIPAAGGFMLHERTGELLALFQEGEHVACFGDVDEMVSAVKHYLSDLPRRNAIAEAGRCLVERAHSWDHRIQTILSYHDSL
jgi:glycosyltransferase involved in cell wall biosynthesis